MTVRLMRWIIAAGFFTALYGSSTAAQTPDSVKVDSTAVWSKNTRYYYTRVKVDTVVKPPTLPSGTNRVLFGASQYPADSLGPVYTVTVTQLLPATMLADLARIKARGGKIVLTLARKPTRAWDSLATNAEGGKGDSVLSVAATQKYLATWPDSAKLNPYFRDGTILQIRTSDDIMSKSIWGMDAPNRPRLDSLGLVVKQKYPLAKVSIRALATQMAGYNWQHAGHQFPQWTEYAWPQYAKLDRLGTPEQYRDVQMASAKAQNLCLVFGFNATGYDESTPAEIENYGKVFGPYTPYFTYWWYELPYSERPDIKVAFQKLRAAMDTTAYRGCARA